MNDQLDKPEIKLYFTSCANCGWEDETGYEVFEEAEENAPEACPHCRNEDELGIEYTFT